MGNSFGSMIRTLPATRANNFDAIRLAAAVAVVVSHSVALGVNGTEPLLGWTRQLKLGEIAVAVFFIVSGYLISQSWDRNQRPGVFLLKRALRIWPALIVVTVLTLPAAALLSSDPGYWTDVRTPAYLLNIVLPGHLVSLPGVFTGNAWDATVNGPLWTLTYEAACYLGVLAIGALGFSRRAALPILLLMLAGTMLVWREPWFEFGAYFAGGAVLYWRPLPRDGRLAMLSAGIVVLFAGLGIGLIQALATAGAYLVVFVALSRPALPAARFGDLSYGLYITAWPIQQTVVQLAGGQLHPWLILAISLPLALGAAFVLWHLVEKRALAFKPSRLGHSEPVGTKKVISQRVPGVRPDAQPNPIGLGNAAG